MLSLILICAVFGLLFLFQRNKNNNEPPVLSGGLPIIGHAHRLIGDNTHLWTFIKYIHNEIQKHNATCYFHVGPMKIYFVSEPDDILTVANTCLQKNEFYKFAKSIVGEGLVTGTGNCTLSKGGTCFMFIYGVHHSPIWGPDADEFKPERWLDEDNLPKPATAFVGFSAGKRNCIGKGYAIMFLKTTLAHVFRHYKVKGDHTKVELKLDVTLKPLSGHHISIQRKKQ